MEPKALIFDTFGTVVDWRGSLIAELTSWGRQRDIAADWVGLVHAWRAAYQPSMDRVRKGERPWALLDALHRETLDRLLDEFNVPGLGEADRRHLNSGWHRLKPWPDSIPGLSRLKRRFIIAPLSNGNVSLLLNMAKNAGIPWDMIFGSDLFERFKPDPATYLGAARLLDLAPGEVMMCAAHNSDLRAAQALGVQTAFFPRPTEYNPRRQRDLAPDGDWTVVAKDIEDLATRLGA